MIFGHHQFQVRQAIVTIYYVLISKFLWTFPVAKKSQAYSICKSFHALIQTQFERTIKNFQCDNGTKFVNGPFQNLFELNGMQFGLSCPQTFPQTGKFEQHIRSINNIMRTLLAHVSISPSFWHHAALKWLLTFLTSFQPKF